MNLLTRTTEQKIKERLTFSLETTGPRHKLKRYFSTIAVLIVQIRIAGIRKKAMGIALANVEQGRSNISLGSDCIQNLKGEVL